MEPITPRPPASLVTLRGQEHPPPRTAPSSVTTRGVKRGGQQHGEVTTSSTSVLVRASTSPRGTRGDELVLITSGEHLLSGTVRSSPALLDAMNATVSTTRDRHEGHLQHRIKALSEKDQKRTELNRQQHSHRQHEMVEQMHTMAVREDNAYRFLTDVQAAKHERTLELKYQEMERRREFSGRRQQRLAAQDSAAEALREVVYATPHHNRNPRDNSPAVMSREVADRLLVMPIATSPRAFGAAVGDGANNNNNGEADQQTVETSKVALARLQAQRDAQVAQQRALQQQSLDEKKSKKEEHLCALKQRLDGIVHAAQDDNRERQRKRREEEERIAAWRWRRQHALRAEAIERLKHQQQQQPTCEAPGAATDAPSEVATIVAADEDDGAQPSEARNESSKKTPAASTSQSPPTQRHHLRQSQAVQRTTESSALLSTDATPHPPQKPKYDPAVTSRGRHKPTAAPSGGAAVSTQKEEQHRHQRVAAATAKSNRGSPKKPTESQDLTSNSGGDATTQVDATPESATQQTVKKSTTVKTKVTTATVEPASSQSPSTSSSPPTKSQRQQRATQPADDAIGGSASAATSSETTPRPQRTTAAAAAPVAQKKNNTSSDATVGHAAATSAPPSGPNKAEPKKPLHPRKKGAAAAPEAVDQKQQPHQTVEPREHAQSGRSESREVDGADVNVAASTHETIVSDANQKGAAPPPPSMLQPRVSSPTTEHPPKEPVAITKPRDANEEDASGTTAQTKGGDGRPPPLPPRVSSASRSSQRGGVGATPLMSAAASPLHANQQTPHLDQSSSVVDPAAYAAAAIDSAAGVSAAGPRATPLVASSSASTPLHGNGNSHRLDQSSSVVDPAAYAAAAIDSAAGVSAAGPRATPHHLPAVATPVSSDGDAQDASTNVKPTDGSPPRVTSASARRAGGGATPIMSVPATPMKQKDSQHLDQSSSVVDPAAYASAAIDAAAGVSASGPRATPLPSSPLQTKSDAHNMDQSSSVVDPAYAAAAIDSAAGVSAAGPRATPVVLAGMVTPVRSSTAEHLNHSSSVDPAKVAAGAIDAAAGTYAAGPRATPMHHLNSADITEAQEGATTATTTPSKALLLKEAGDVDEEPVTVSGL